MGPTNTRIVPKYIEAGFLSEEGRRAFVDCGEIATVDMKTFEVPRAVWIERLYGLDCSGDVGRRAAGDVDCSILRIENLDEFKPNTCISASNDKNFACLRREVLFGECWLWGEKLSESSTHD